MMIKDRKELIQKEKERITQLVSKDQSVLTIILFGSAVELNDTNEWSDVDLCIIQNTELRFLDRTAYWIDVIEPKIGIDIVVYTPEEFEDMRKNSPFVHDEIVVKGKELYAA